MINKNFTTDDMPEEPKKSMDSVFNAYVKKGETALFLITSEQALQVHLHNLYKTKALDAFDCVCIDDTDEAGKEECPLCLAGGYKSATACFRVLNIGRVDIGDKAPIIDLYESKKGDLVQPLYEQVWKVKRDSYGKLLKAIRMSLRKKSIPTFQYILVEVSRGTGAKSPASGDNFNNIKQFKSVKKAMEYIAETYDGGDNLDIDAITEAYKENAPEFEWENALTVYKASYLRNALQIHESNQKEQAKPFKFKQGSDALPDDPQDSKRPELSDVGDLPF